jgi:hypothetical protein
VFISRYNPSLVPQLEAYVDEQVPVSHEVHCSMQWLCLALSAMLDDQVRTGSYDLNANLALLRHYNFSPEKASISIIARVLIKAQMRLPEHDFSQMLHLIPERLQVCPSGPALGPAACMV